MTEEHVVHVSVNDDFLRDVDPAEKELRRLEWERAKACTCGRIRVGMTVTENRNWNPDCADHGLGTEWHAGEGGDRLRAQNKRAVELQKQANEARRKARE